MATDRVSIAVFNRNLRVADNPVLTASAAADRVLPLFVADPRIADGDFSNPRRQHFLNAGLADLDASLRHLGAGLVFRRGDPVEEIGRLAYRFDAESVHVAADVSGYAVRREDRLRRMLAEQRRGLIVHEAVNTVQPAGDLAPAGGDHYRVFTPYFRRWVATPHRPLLPAPERLRLPDGLGTGRVPQGQQVAGWTGGETAGRRVMQDWLDDGLAGYPDSHDDLAADRTSRLSPYLHLGNISAVELVTLAEQAGGPAAQAFIRQLAWRDFHHQVLAARPDAAWQDYRPRGDHWSEDASALTAWQHGRTGYPMVDAGMRQLAETGWMHNRARMVVASFLTKTLHQDWRLGARHFLAQLLDGDLANNNLNWQWVAGTGTDTRPNRVLNPVRQSRRYDPAGTYLRRWVGELAGLGTPEIHQPWLLPEAERRALGYPEPIIDLAAGRDQFRQGRQ